MCPEDLQQACAEVDQKAGEKSNFRKRTVNESCAGYCLSLCLQCHCHCVVSLAVLAELSESGAELERAVAREAELFTPQQYEATFERRLFRNTLGLDIRLTQGVWGRGYIYMNVQLAMCGIVSLQTGSSAWSSPTCVQNSQTSSSEPH